MTTIKAFIKRHPVLSYYRPDIRYLMGRHPHRGRGRS